MKEYPISMEIAGPFAMWARPDSGSTPTSYPIPTWSAVKGIFESIAFFHDGKAWIRPTRVEICKPQGAALGEVRFQKYTTNYRGPLKEKNKVNFQFSALILADVCYRLYGVIENGSGEHLQYGANPSHHLQALFQRRLQKGQCYKTPCLGWNEFVPSYWGAIRDNDSGFDEKTEVDSEINLNLVSILNHVFDRAIAGKYSPSFSSDENACVKKGVFTYAE